MSDLNPTSDASRRSIEPDSGAGRVSETSGVEKSDSVKGGPVKGGPVKGGPVKSATVKSRAAAGKSRISAADRALTRVSLVAASALALSAIPALRESWSLGRELWMIQATGWIACAGLLLSLSMTPAARLVAWLNRRRPAMARWIAYRRAFGIASAVMAIFHALFVLTTYLDDAWPAVLYWPYLRSGATALAVLVALLVTSFPGLVASMGIRSWKELHRLAYIAAPLVLHHLLLAPFPSRRLTLGLFAFWLAFMGLRFLPRRQPAVAKPAE